MWHRRIAAAISTMRSMQIIAIVGAILVIAHDDSDVLRR